MNLVSAIRAPWREALNPKTPIAQEGSLKNCLALEEVCIKKIKKEIGREG